MKPRATLLLSGGARGANDRLLEEYSAAFSEKEPRRAVWLAPASTAAGQVRDQLAIRLDRAALHPGVTTFAGFADQLLVAAGTRVRPLGQIESRRLLEGVIAEAAAAGRLSYFAAVVDAPGFVSQAAQFIAEAKRRDAWAEELQKRAVAPRDRELAYLYGQYQRRLAHAKAYDAEGLFWAARDAVKGRGELLRGYGLIVVAGFTDFTAAQFDILQQLAKSAGKLVIALTVDEPALAGDSRLGRIDLFARTLATRSALRDRIVCTEEFLAASDDRSANLPAMRVVAERLFAVDSTELPVDPHPSPTNRGSSPRPSGIEIIAAPSVQREFEEVAARVKRQLVQGTAAEDVVVTLRSTAESARRWEEVFADHGVPVWIDVRPPLAATPLVQGLLTLLRLSLEDWAYRPLLATVGRTDLNWVGETAADRSERQRVRAAVEHCVREAQLAAGRDTLLAFVREWIERADAAEQGGAELSEELAERAAAARLALPALAGLAERLAELPTRATIADWLIAVENLARSTGLLGTRTHDVAAWGALAAAGEAVLRADRLAERETRQLDLAGIAVLLANLASQANAPGGGDATGKVRVLAADRARHLRPRHLFLAGLSEQSFAPSGRDARRAVDERFSELLAASNEGGADEAGRGPGPPSAADEMLLFYELTTLPVETLTLSYPALDAKAQPLPPSPFLEELQRCFPGGAPLTSIPLGEAGETPPPQDATSASGYRRAAAAAALDGASAPLATLLQTAEAGQTARSIVSGLAVVGQRALRDAFGPSEGVLSSDAARTEFTRRFGADHLWSPSQLESYALCPFKFYAEQVLKLRPAPELALESDYGRRGVLLHNTLAELHRRLALTQAVSGDQPLGREELIAGYRQALEELTKHPPRSGLESALYEIERRQIDSWAEQLADQELQYRGYFQQWDEPPRPRYFEARFGPGSRRSESAADADLSTERPYELVLAKERLRVTGQIDRIDLGRLEGRAAFNVIDYKTGARSTASAEKMADGRQLQLPLYALAAEELLLKEQGALAWAAGYWTVQGSGFGKPGTKSGPLLTAQQGKSGLAADPGWTALRNQLRERIAEIVAGIRRAEFPVFSADPHCTGYCPLRTTCRIAHVRSLQKSWHGAVIEGSDEEGDPDD